MAPATGRQWKGKGGQKASQRLEAGRDASPSLRQRGQLPSLTKPHKTLHRINTSPTFHPHLRPKSIPKVPQTAFLHYLCATSGAKGKEKRGVLKGRGAA
jgi:hypothetical protein